MCIVRSSGKGQMLLPQFKRYLELRNAKVLGNFKAGWCLQVTKYQIAGSHQFPLCGFSYVRLEHYHFKTEMPKSLLDDLKMRWRRIINFWRMPYLVLFPLIYLNKCISFQYAHRILWRIFFLCTDIHAIYILYHGQSREWSHNTNLSLMPKTLPKEINRPFILTAQNLFVSKYLWSKSCSFYRKKLDRDKISWSLSIQIAVKKKKPMQFFISPIKSRKMTHSQHYTHHIKKGGLITHDQNPQVFHYLSINLIRPNRVERWCSI